MAELPRCAVCRVSVEPGQNVVFRSDGRVNHADAPPVTCPVCSRLVRPEDPIRRDSDGLVHGNCWARRYRSEPKPAAAPNGEHRLDVAAIIRDKLTAGMLPAPPVDRKVWAG